MQSPRGVDLASAARGEGALVCSKPGFVDAPRLLLTSDEVLAVLQEKIAFRFKNVRDSFNFYNTGKDGKISERDFRDMLVCIGIDMTETEYQKLYCNFDRDCDGAITYYEWNNVVGGLIYPLSDITLSRPESPNRIKEWTHRALGRGLTHMIKPASAGGSQDPVEAAFREINTCRSGYISHQEFVQLLKRMKVPYGDDEETFCVFKKFQNRKVNTTGQLTLPEFRALVQHYTQRPVAPKLSIEAMIAPKSAKELHAMFNRKIVTKYATVQRAWREMDMDKDNVLSHAELVKNFAYMNIPLEGAMKEEVLREFDPTNKGHVSYQDFSKVVGALIHPNAKDTSKAMVDMEETSGAQGGLYFVPTARLGGNLLDSEKARLEEQRDAVRLGDAALPPLPPMESISHKLTGFRSPRSSQASSSGEHVELVGFSSENSSVGAASARGGGSAAGAAAGGSSAAAAAAAAAPALVLAPVSVEALEERMRKVLGRGWVHAAADIKRLARGGGKVISTEALRDVLAEKGVPLTAREVNALAAQYGGEGGAGGVNVDGLLTHAFKASFAGAAPPARKPAAAAAAPSASTARLAASVQSAAAATARPSAFVKAGSSKVGIF